MELKDYRNNWDFTIIKESFQPKCCRWVKILGLYLYTVAFHTWIEPPVFQSGNNCSTPSLPSTHHATEVEMLNKTCMKILILFQVVPVSTATIEVRRNRGFAINELVFQVQAPPLGYTTYTVSLLEGGLPPASAQPHTPPAIQNKVYGALCPWS